MLANHHDCGAPMFRYQGKVTCPVCDFQDKKSTRVTGNQEIQVEKTESGSLGMGQGTSEPAHIQDMSGIAGSDIVNYDDTRFIIRKKISTLVKSLENETDLQRVKDKMDCIEQGIRILKLIKN